MKLVKPKISTIKAKTKQDLSADPDGGIYQNCAGIYFTEDGFAGRWFDDSCDTQYRYICESGF